jgi:hypothetical protein
MKPVILLSLASAIACVIAALVIMSRKTPKVTSSPPAIASGKFQPAPPANVNQPVVPPTEAAPAAAPVAAPSSTTPVEQNASPPEPLKAAPRARSGAAGASQAGVSTKEPLQDPLARLALAFVGADPIAEEYWFAAINDPSLPAQERQDLIEDLNEDGLSDTKRPGPGDLPLILNRLVLIENIAPTAPDQVNADALQEAYKDLQQLARVALGSGEIVR